MDYHIKLFDNMRSLVHSLLVSVHSITSRLILPTLQQKFYYIESLRLLKSLILDYRVTSSECTRCREGDMFETRLKT